MTQSAKGLLAGFLGYAIFAAHDVVVKLLSQNYSVFQILFFSIIFGFPVAILLHAREVSERNLLPVHPYWVTFRAFVAAMAGLCVFYAFQTIPFAQAYALLFTMPLFITLLSVPFLGEAVGVRRFAAVILGLVGVVVVLNPSGLTLQLGHLTALIGAFFAALGAIILRKIGPDERPVVLLLAQMFGGLVVFGALMPLGYKPPQFHDILALMFMAGLAAIAGFCIIHAFRTAPAAVVAPSHYSQILWAVFYGYLIFDETPRWNTLVGSALIVASGIYILLRENRKEGSLKPAERSRVSILSNLVASSITRRLTSFHSKE